jgi:hypothetical protein
MASQVDIVPALGHGVVSLQDPTIGWDAIDDRRRASVGKQEGAVEAGSYKVTPGALMTVDVAGDAGSFLVEGDSVAHQGLYVVAPVAAPLTLDVPASDPSLPRFDRIILEVKDANLDGSGLSVARVRYLTGTPTSGANLDTPSGAPTVPDTAALLADHVVPAGSSSVNAANIRDRRTWALGAYKQIVRTANASGVNDYRTTSTTLVVIDGTNLSPRIECSGAPVRVSLRGSGYNTSAGSSWSLALLVDGTNLISAAGRIATGNSSAVNEAVPLGASWDFKPTPGSHKISPAYTASAGTAGLFARPDTPLQLVVEELVGRESASND